MYRNLSRYIATEQERQVYRRWVLGCAIVYGLPLLYLAALAIFVGHVDVPHRDAERASIASTIGRD